MEANPAVRPSLPSYPNTDHAYLFGLARWMLAALLATFVNVSGITLALRRGAGVLVEPLNPTIFILLILAAAWAAGLGRYCFLQNLAEPLSEGDRFLRTRAPRSFSVWAYWVLVAPSLFLIALLAAVAIPGTGTRPMVVAVGVLVAEELLVGFEAMRKLRGWTLRANHRDTSGDEPPLQLLSPERDWVERDDSLYQRMVRHRLSADLDHIEADCVAVFETGQRYATEHLAFCPPFHSSPDIHCEQTEGAGAKISVIRCLAYGARVELRLPVPAEAPMKVAFRLTATSPAAATAVSA